MALPNLEAKLAAAALRTALAGREFAEGLVRHSDQACNMPPQVGMSKNFAVHFEDPAVYQSSATMLHFYAEFIYQPRALPELTSTEVLAELAGRPRIGAA